MNRKIALLFLLCAVVLLPRVATSQFFAKQKVVVWAIFDRNNDVKVADGTKTQIRTSIVDAFVSSRNYEAFEANMNDVKNRITAKGLTMSPVSIAKVVRELYKVDFVLFTTIKVIQHANSYDNFQVHLTSDLFSAETQKSERMAYVDMRSDVKEIPAACARLLSNLLGEQLTAQSQSTGSMSQQPAYQQPASRQPAQPSYPQQTYSQMPQNYVEQANCGLNMKMVYVEGGQFQMGATSEQSGEAYGDESPVHHVQLESFYIAECEVTQAQWQKIMGTTVYQQRDKAGTSNSMRGVGDDHPIYYVNWEEAQMFCRELSALTGKTYLLPTEAQWEYAARGGKNSRKYKYSGSYAIDAVAWYTSNSGDATHPVKQKRANELGLYDMSGNVWEWCSDWYGSYPSSMQNNPTGASSGQNRVLRGGSWGYDARDCRVSRRDDDTPSGRNGHGGFRVVCLP